MDNLKFSLNKNPFQKSISLQDPMEGNSTSNDKLYNLIKNFKIIVIVFNFIKWNIQAQSTFESHTVAKNLPHLPF